MFIRTGRALPRRPARLASYAKDEADKSPSAVLDEIGRFIAGFLGLALVVQLLADLWR